MGNILADCRRCEVCDAARLGIDQCELRTDALSGHQSSNQQGGSGATHRRAAGGNAGQAGARHEYQPADMTEADMIEQALRLSRLTAERSRQGTAPRGSEGTGTAAPAGRPGPLTADEEAELVAAAVRKTQMEEENRERRRLIAEQEAEYEESLRIDREREAEKALRQKEEEERRQREAAEEEAKKREAEKLEAEAEEAERVRKARVEAALEEARKHLTPEPEAGVPGRIQVLVRTPQGARLQRAFLGSDSVGLIYHYVNAEGGEALAGADYRLVSSMPRAVYEDREATLEAAGLKGQCALLVEVIEED
uniref:UBX domain-containing protein n=1 Tax=Alexandrium monilatum TaxID=311494 RepID=A0A7S4UF83_9DINO